MTPTILVQKAITRSIVRKQTFQVRNMEGVLAVLECLMSERHTGPITIFVSQGGVLGISAEDKATLPEI